MPPAEFMLIPRDVSTSSAIVWAGTTSPVAGASFAIEHQISATTWPIDEWQQWSADGAASPINYTRVRLSGLSSGTHYPLLLTMDGRTRAEAAVTTLPTVLPAVTEAPFTVLLGSCFCVAEDAGGDVGRTFARIPGALRPQVKLLVGDQVYLDSPWSKFIVPHGARRLADAFLQQYLNTWTQGADQYGFNLLLRSGANYLCGDDHEFWNNVPFPSSFVVDTWTTQGRRQWSELAASLYHVFQTDRTFDGFDIGHFSLRILDTRINRTRDRARFVSEDDMAKLRAWVGGLAGPGVLVLSQPVFTTKAGFFGRYADWQLADFDQYADLCNVLLTSRQSIILCCGDVHFGRIARATLPSGAELVEIVSSPMTLVDALASGKWDKAPATFPAEAIPGIARVRVATEENWKINSNHFVTMELHGDGGGVRCRVRPWLTRGSPLGMGEALEIVLPWNAES